MFVCLSVQASPFLCMLPVAVARSSSNGVATRYIQGGPKKVRPLRLKAQIFACPHLQNAQRNFSDFWPTLTLLYSEYICWRCGHAKIWAFKRSGLTFLDHPVLSVLYMTSRFHSMGPVGQIMHDVMSRRSLPVAGPSWTSDNYTTRCLSEFVIMRHRGAK